MRTMKELRRIHKPFIIFLILLLAFPGVLFSQSARTVEAAGTITTAIEIPLENPGFENGDALGWTVTGATYAVSVERDADNARSGDHYLNYWFGDRGYEFQLSQTVSGLEDGSYELKAWAAGDVGDADLQLFANTVDASGNSSTQTTAIVNSGWGGWSEYVVRDIEVVGGEITIGFDVAAPVGYWGCFDDVQLVKITEEEPSDPSEFIKGVDISTLQALEDIGVKYYEGGVEKDLLEILKNHGVNYVRLRVWNDPVQADGYNDKAHTVEMAQRVKAAGMKLLVDFHYSDFWADPGQQVKPASWEDLSFTELKQAVYDYTTEVLSELDAVNAYPDMVQVGNEINSGMLLPDGAIRNFNNLAELLKQGIQGVRDTTPANHETKIMLHLAEGGSNSKFRSFFDQIQARGVEYDIIGLSYYPYWHGTFQDLKSNLDDLVTRYGKQVVVVETAYAYTYENGDDHGNIVNETETDIAGFPASVDNQKLVIETVFHTVANVRNQKGLGVFYWEPAWLPGVGWKSGEGNAWENQAMFDYDGNVLESLNVFQFMPGSITEKLPILVYPADKITVAKGVAPLLPATVKVLYNEGTISQAAVTWDSIAEEQLQTPGTFKVQGKITGMEKKAQIEITVLAQENMVKNAGFESGDLSHWTLTGTSSAGKVESNAGNARSGSHAFNYWYDAPYSYQLTQTIAELPNGTYALRAWASGGGGETELKLFAEDSAGIVLSTEMVNTGWNNWTQYAIEDIEVKDGQLTIGFDVEAPAEVWGYFDDVELVLTKEEPTSPTPPTPPTTPTSPGAGGGTTTASNSGAGTAEPVKSESDSGQVRIQPDQIKINESGVGLVTVAPSVNKIILTEESIAMLGESKLEMTNGSLSLVIPADVLQQLIKSSGASSGYEIVLQFAAVDHKSVEAALKRGALQDKFTSIKILGQAYDFKLSVITRGGADLELQSFASSITVRIKLDAVNNLSQTGIFYISNEGQLEYVGGQWSNGEISAPVHHFSQYAVLELTKRFTDVPETYWAYNAVSGLASRQIVAGAPNGTYNPGTDVSRAEFAVMLARALKLEPEVMDSFADVSRDAWYYDTLSGAYQAGLVLGRNDRTFDPSAPVTRQEMAVMLMKAYALQGGAAIAQEASHSFKDAMQISDWAATAVNSAHSLGLIHGRGQEEFAPKAHLTRAEAAQVVYQLLSKQY
ncbi:glycosyl hydrolase 53 family protein [Paenibacillus bouchesdurhonensis]|uniref:glycosyl hydrolase 53 family protein n=1 Tax=Paenibacillus bouchesdurhonensis TaxID=1870990 RepID=UPI0018FF9D72|nr:glycosyl hydrolase 53 family protein [Paenibacillus bouchesdurhonensis]